MIELVVLQRVVVVVVLLLLYCLDGVGARVQAHWQASRDAGQIASERWFYIKNGRICCSCVICHSSTDAPCACACAVCLTCSLSRVPMAGLAAGCVVSSRLVDAIAASPLSAVERCAL